MTVQPSIQQYTAVSRDGVNHCAGARTLDRVGAPSRAGPPAPTPAKQCMGGRWPLGARSWVLPSFIIHFLQDLIFFFF